MRKSLVIVESPAKAKTINKYLGKGFIVKSSIGHIRDLPTSGSNSRSQQAGQAKSKNDKIKLSAAERAAQQKIKAFGQLVARMGVDPDNQWRARYEILPGKEKVVAELKKLAMQADTVYLATDLDREGEAIAWHLQQAIGEKTATYKRVVFNEITKNAITEAFEAPSELNINRVHAQQARRFLDRVVGFMISPLLWKKIARGLSAGRVQSVAVRLIVEREREIRAFLPEEYWELYADTQTPKQEPLRLQVMKAQGKAFRPNSKAAIDPVLATLKNSIYRIASIEERPTQSKPSAPFITSTLQQAASTRLHFGVKKTMLLAQRLYEAGHITYMRTDSTNLSQDAVESCRAYIKKQFSQDYLPPNAQVYSSKKGAQEAHEAIRPSDVLAEPGKLTGVESDAVRLYELIWRQFVACQMMPARYLSTSVIVEADHYELKAKGRSIVFDGFTRVQSPAARKNDEVLLPKLAKDDLLNLQALDPKQLFTKPPARYAEASLVRELEKQGIGRPSTYASIISTIQDRGYVALENRRFYAQKIGDIVTDRLVENFVNLMDYNFTAIMEEQLDEVAEGKQNWITLLDQFYAKFRTSLDRAQADNSDSMRANEPTLTDIPCLKCQRPMQIRTASTGVFLGCSGYNLPVAERCKSTINLVHESAGSMSLGKESDETQALRDKRRCALCHTAMEVYGLDGTRRLHICGNNPDCTGYEVEQGTFAVAAYDGPTLECDKCGHDMLIKSGRFGKYFGCSNEECKNTRKLLKSGQPAPPKMDPVPMPELKCSRVNDTYVLRDGAAGLFLAASGFPKNRETRAPLVRELLAHQSEIDPKYQFLFSAPTEDHEGNPTLVRFSRKLQQQYVMSEKSGKASGWSAHYVEGKWEVKKTKSR